MDDFSKSVASNANKTGQDAINSFIPSQTASNQLSGFNALTASQMGQSNDYINKYANTVAANPSVTSLYDQGNAKFNVPQLQTQATNLQNQVSNAYPTQLGLARGFDASQGQVDNATNQSLKFLQPQANQATANANTASGLASNYVQAGQAQNAMNLLPIQAQQAFLQQQQGNQASNMNAVQGNEFGALQQKMMSGVALSGTEMAQYQYLLGLQGTQSTNAALIQNTIQGQKQAIIPSTDRLVNTFAQGILNPATGQTTSY